MAVLKRFRLCDGRLKFIVQYIFGHLCYDENLKLPWSSIIRLMLETRCRNPSMMFYILLAPIDAIKLISTAVY